MPIPFVGRRFTPPEFEDYLSEIEFTTFQPKYVVLHHTGVPSLAQRPNGFSEQHLRNLEHYYGAPPRPDGKGGKGWSGAPHLFIDDRDDGIIVFQRLDRRGVHAASFNSNSWGIEMLGNYDEEPFHTGRGAAIRDLAMEALALMCKRLGVKADTIRFHRDDPLTTKRCPGNKVSKADVIQRVSEKMSAPPPPELTTEASPAWTVFLPDGTEYLDLQAHQGRPIAHVRRFLNLLSPGGAFRLTARNTRVEWTPTDRPAVSIPVALLDEDGKAWGFVRDLATAAGKTVSVSGRKITLT